MSGRQLPPLRARSAPRRNRRARMARWTFAMLAAGRKPMGGPRDTVGAIREAIQQIPGVLHVDVVNSAPAHLDVVVRCAPVDLLRVVALRQEVANVLDDQRPAGVSVDIRIGP